MSAIKLSTLEKTERKHESKGCLDKHFPWLDGELCFLPTLPIFSGGKDMRDILISDWFHFGRIWQLTNLPLGPLGENKDNIWHCYGLLTSYAEDENIKKEMPAFAECCGSFAKVISRLFSDNFKNGKPIQEDDLKQYKHWFRELSTLLISETGKLTTIMLEENQVFGVDTLWKNPMKMLTEDVSKHLSKFVKENYIEAAKCLALNCHTAVGFHAMRSVEKIARTYYELTTGKTPPYVNKKGEEYYKGLGSIANDLLDAANAFQHKKEDCGDLLLIAPAIKGLCKVYRDPLSHPEIIILSENEAIDVFIETTQLVKRVVRDVGKGTYFIKAWGGDQL